MSSAGVLPSGTVTFLFTDIEGSTKLWEQFAEAMGVALATHDELVRAAIDAHGGVVFATGGDGVAAAFSRAGDAVAAAVDAQRALQGAVWPDGVALRVRMGAHTGEAEERDGDFFGPPVNRAARLMSAAHGGQVVVSEATAAVLGTVEGLRLVDLGSHRLKGVVDEMRVFGVDADGLGWLDRALVTEQVVPGNLPRPATEYVGRVDVLQERAVGLADRRLVTLTGTGGVGKTRSAVEVGWLLTDHFSGGVWLVELAPVIDDGVVIATVASALGVSLQAGMSMTESIVAGLQGRRALLILDNCEHVLAPVVELVSAITVGCELVTVLATSREPLGVAGERVIPVPSMDVANAVELFIERAQAADESLVFGTDDHAVIGEVCGRLDGIPLAIELAAARARSMSVVQIRDRLDQRFRLLTGSRRSIERHQTLRHTVQWSYDLLESFEQGVLQQVSVFAGGFTLPAALAICGGDGGVDEFDMLDALDSLVRKSLLQLDRSDGEVRYEMLETIRQFAEEALADTGDSDAVRDRHARYFADQAGLAFAAFWTEDEWLAYRFVEGEISNLGVAFQWALSRQDTDAAVRIAANTELAARNRLRTEAFGWPEQALDLARRDEHRQLPHLLAAACDTATGSGRHDDAVRFGLEALTLNHDDRYDFTVHAYWTTAMALAFTGEADNAIGMLREGAEHPADTPARTNLLYLHILAQFGAVVMSTQEAMDGITQLKASSTPTMRAGGLWLQALAVADDDPSAAIALCQQALDANTGSRSLEENVRGLQLGLIAQTDDIDAALIGFTRIVDAYQASSGDLYTKLALRYLVAWLARLGYHDAAARLGGADTRGRLDYWADPLPEIGPLTDTMGDDAFTAAFHAGAALDARAVGELAQQLLTQVRADHLDT